MSKTFKQYASENWTAGPEGRKPTMEEVQVGVLQRIADAVEKSVEDRRKIDSELAYYKKRNPELRQEIDSLNRKISASEGVKTKLKKKISHSHAIISRLVNAFSFDKGRDGDDLTEQNSALKEAQAFLDKINVGK